MLLCFGDVHLGNKFYHTLTSNNITTSEMDNRYALDAIYKRSSLSDVSAVVCVGDFFHTPKPTPENIRWTINWIEKMDSLNKPFYIIPGNHDVGAFYTSISFIYALSLKNVIVITNTVQKFTWKNWNLNFVPFVAAKSLKDKYLDTNKLIDKTINELNVEENNIIFTHMQEQSSKLGSESQMFARTVGVMDLGEYPTKNNNTFFITGHMHMHQIYKKNSGINVIYPGSLCHLEMTDCGQSKGYILFNENRIVKFETIPGARIFKKYILPKGNNPEDFFSKIRMSRNEVVFLEISLNEQISEYEIRFVLNKCGAVLGKIIRTSDKTKKNTFSEDRNENKYSNPHAAIELYLSNYDYGVEEFGWKETILPLGKEIIDEVRINRD